MAKSSARKSREKEAKQKGYDFNANRRGGQHIAISTVTKMTKTKSAKLNQNKHKKRQFSEHDQGNGAFIIGA